MSSAAPERIFAGLGLRLLSVGLLASMQALVKLAEARGASLPETMFFRQACAVPLVLAWIAAGPGLASIRTRRIGAHLTRTIVGLMGMVCTFGAVLLLPLAEAMTLQFTVPIFATILSALVLREPTGRHRWAAVVLGFAGVLIVAQPGSGAFPLSGALVGLLAALLVAVIAILLRQIGRTEPAATTVFWFSLLSLPPLGIVYLFNLQPHDPATWAILVTVGLVGGLGQLAITASVRFAPVATVVPMDYSSLIWGIAYGWLFFGTLPAEGIWIGAPVIIASGLYIVYREHVLQRRDTDRAIGD
ncbi:drug/metabolite transporter (DMT)-like permease [Hephaestia caeni]|uniref:Drug/metabolite transporter (DMT)-like permease n=1 Tax=Hephaestia caeni TaxID=645617 RepID=A0A397NPI3_9SPHN|nr:DMT family transporter [Hephaestia caeni]RIA37569.1 drug/metabolite transporter (DMT)-like permease [Hephaestia caeni]